MALQQPSFERPVVDSPGDHDVVERIDDTPRFCCRDCGAQGRHLGQFRGRSCR